uniref:Uncharacterized protein n=1 Tax=Anguilla anguilla TaxID=7936 RepID=A0A0E9TM45_ANGAN
MSFFRNFRNTEVIKKS